MSSLLNIQNITIHPNYPKTKIKVHAPDRIGLVGFHDKGFVIAKPAEPYSAWLQDRCRELHN